MALPAIAIPVVMGIMRFVASKGVTQAVKKYGKKAYNDALTVAKDKGTKGQQVRQQLQRMAEKDADAVNSIPKPVRDLMIPKGSNKVPARKEAPLKAERDTPVTPKKESTSARVAERKERQRVGAERKAAEQASRTPRKNASATTAGVTGATAIASSVEDKPKARTGGGRGDGAAELKARREQARKEKDKKRVDAATRANRLADEGEAKGKTGGNLKGSKSYKVKKGDTLSEIARDNDTTVKELMAKNKKIKNKDLIYAGDTLKLNRGGVVKANCGASMKPNRKART